MEKITPSIRVKVRPSGLPFDAWQYFEVGKPITIDQLHKGDFFLDISTGLEHICMVCSDPVSSAEDEDEDETITLGAYSWRETQCDYEFDPSDYERLEEYPIPAGFAHALLFPLIALDSNE